MVPTVTRSEDEIKLALELVQGVLNEFVKPVYVGNGTGSAIDHLALILSRVRLTNLANASHLTSLDCCVSVVISFRSYLKARLFK